MPSIFAAMGVPKSERDPLGRWSPVLCATDEEEAIDEVRVYAARLGNIDADILQESAHSMVTTARIFYGLWSMDPAVTPAQVPTVQGEPSIDQDKGFAENAKYLIVLSKKGAMLRLHLAAGCWKAQTRTFASYELCDLDPVPKNLYTHYCRGCWPAWAPGFVDGSGEDDGLSSASSSSTDS